jgi:hypothetical protein
MTTTRYPKGTIVQYHGSKSYMHGYYFVSGYYDVEVLRPDLTAEEKDKYYPDGEAYELWPLDMPFKFGNRENGLFSVRRGSFTPTPYGVDMQAVTADVVDEAVDQHLDDVADWR